MARSLKHCSTEWNPEAWVLEPSAWGFVMDIWGRDIDVEDFAAEAQSFPVSGRSLLTDRVSFVVDGDAASAQPPEVPASWAFDPERWGFATGWNDRSAGDS